MGVSSVSHFLKFGSVEVLALWPPLGFASFALIAFGRKGVLGIITGFLLFYGMFHPTGHSHGFWFELTYHGNWVIQLGSAILGAFVTRPYLRRHRLVGDSFSSLLTFSGVAAVPAALVCSTGNILATPDNLSGTADGIIKLWSGLVLGNIFAIAAFLPFAVLFFEASRSKAVEYFRRFALPYALSMMGVFFFVWVLRGVEENQIQQHTDNLLNRYVAEIVKAKERCEDLVIMMEQGLGATSEINPQIFERIAVVFSRRLPGIQAINLAVEVPGDKVNTFLDSFPTPLGSEFNIWELDTRLLRLPAPPRDTYLPYVWTYPENRNLSVIGMNVWEHPAIGPLAVKAMSSNAVYASGPIQLVQETGGQMGINIYAPLDLNNPAHPHRFMLNIVLLCESFLNFGRIAVGAKTENLQVIDLDSNRTAPLLGFTEVPLARSHEQLHHANFSGSRKVDFFGRTWEVNLKGDGSELPFGGRLGSTVATVGGFFFLVVLGFFQVLQFERERLVKTEVSNRTRDLLAAKEAAEKAAAVKNEFLAVTNHELRTPLNGIIATSEILLEGNLDPEHRRLATMIQSSGHILLDLINDVLDFARMEANRLQLVESSFSIYRLTHELLSVFTVPAQKKGIALRFEKEGDLHQSVLGDSRRINQILLNFLGNSVKFTEKGEVLLRIEVGKIEEGRVPLRFTVKDTGMGIGEGKMKRLFEAFDQEDMVTTRKHGGTGLGLAIAKRLSDAMGGQVRVQSEKGIGTCIDFFITLPIAIKSPEDVREPELQRSGEVKGKRILVVEDNAVNRRVIHLVLKRLGHTEVFAEDGKEALEAAGKSSFDIIFMDLHLPDMDGVTVTEKIRAIGQGWCEDVPIVALTANTTEQMREKCMRAGMQDFMPKPVQVVKIKQLIERWCSSR